MQSRPHPSRTSQAQWWCSPVRTATRVTRQWAPDAFRPATGPSRLPRATVWLTFLLHEAHVRTLPICDCPAMSGYCASSPSANTPNVQTLSSYPTTIGSSVSLSCSDGFVPNSVESMSVSCVPNGPTAGNWTTATATCIGMEFKETYRQRRSVGAGGGTLNFKKSYRNE